MIIRKNEKRQFYAELKAYTIMKGYKPGYTAAKWKDKFKAWPPRDYEEISAASEVSPTVSLWIRAQNIRWANSNHNQRMLAYERGVHRDFLLAALRAASARTKAMEADINTIGVALKGDLISCDTAVRWVREAGLLGMIGAYRRIFGN